MSVLHLLCLRTFDPSQTADCACFQKMYVRACCVLCVVCCAPLYDGLNYCLQAIMSLAVSEPWAGSDVVRGPLCAILACMKELLRQKTQSPSFAGEPPHHSCEAGRRVHCEWSQEVVSTRTSNPRTTSPL